MYYVYSYSHESQQYLFIVMNVGLLPMQRVKKKILSGLDITKFARYHSETCTMALFCFKAVQNAILKHVPDWYCASM